MITAHALHSVNVDDLRLAAGSAATTAAAMPARFAQGHEVLPTTHAMRNFDANTFNRTVLLCHMKHAKTEFMYLPILLTLEQAWQSSGARVHRASSTKRMAALTAGDVVVWVGMGRAVR